MVCAVVTVIVELPENPEALAVIAQVPVAEPTVETSPEELTVQTEVLPELQVNVIPVRAVPTEL